MDRSIDSIGSCSLDADSTDFSDTSESINFISPSATRENFTAGIAERVKKIQTTQPLTPKLILNQPANQRTATTTAYFDVNSGKISTIVSRTDTRENNSFINGKTEKFLSTKTIELQSPTIVTHANKKPSYLNLACCVNGYSNYTNYDSIERKEINKSREVSPIRPIVTMSRQPRSNDNLLSVPQPVTFVKQSPLVSITKRFASLNLSDSKDTTDNAINGHISNRKSFIQERVEKLYGTTKILTTTTAKTSETINLNGNLQHVNGGSSAKEIDEKENDEDFSMNSLPVMKHLRPEFCRQLNFLNSPKKTRNTGNLTNTSKSETHTDTTNLEKLNLLQEINEKEDLKENQNLESNYKEIVMESVINNKNLLPSSEKSENNNINISNNNILNEKMEKVNCEKAQTESEIKDGHYFLKLLNAEKARILKIADEVEKELNDLQSDPSTVPSEEVVGIILSAIGKSRLLATKKFKQFEGLCYENLTPNLDGPQTLSGDLQGFWDMMMLQVDNIDAAFDDLQKCRANGWKNPQQQSPISAPKGTRLTKRPLSQNNKGKVTSVAGKKSSTAPSEAAQKRDEQRKILLEMKRKQKAAMQQNGTLEAENDEKKEN